MFEERVAELEALARELGLDFFPTSFEVVPQDIMTEIAAYGLPTRARHWSYGKVYRQQHLYGTMGLSTIYEIVLNSNPGLAFLLETNPEIANLLVAAHVFGHVDFFKNNVLFAPTNRQMVHDPVAHALRIDRYIERYGLDTVEHLMDIGFALDRHLDDHSRWRLLLRVHMSPPRYSLSTAKPKDPGQTALDATAAAALRTGDEDHAPAARGPRDASAPIVIFVTWLQPSPQNVHPPLQEGG